MKQTVRTTLMEEERLTLNYRKLLLVPLGVFVLTVFYFVIIWFLKNSVTIASAEKTQIAVYSLPSNEIVLESSESNKHDFKLGRGNYVIEVKNNASSSKKTVELGFREVVELEITPDPLLSGVRTSLQKVRDIGAYEDEIVGLQDDSTILVNELGKTVYSQYESPIEKIVFGDNGEFGEIKKNGDFAYTRNLIPRTFHLAQSEQNSNNPAVDTDYNQARKIFCVLLQNGEVFSVNSEGVKTDEFSTSKKNEFVRCEGDVTVVGVYAKFSDGDEKTGTTPGNIAVYKNMGELFNVGSVLLNAIDIIDSNSFVYTDDKTVYSYDLGTKKRNPQQNIVSLGKNSIYVNKQNGFVYIFDEADAWRLDIKNSLSKKVSSGLNFRAVNGVTLNNSGELTYSIDSRSFDYGIYRLTSNANLSKTVEKIKTSLPKRDYFYSAEYVIIGDTVKVSVSVFGDIPSTPASKATARQKAQDFITSLGLDSSVIVTYK